MLLADWCDVLCDQLVEHLTRVWGVSRPAGCLKVLIETTLDVDNKVGYKFKFVEVSGKVHPLAISLSDSYSPYQ